MHSIGFARVHTASVAATYGAQKDALGSLHGFMDPLRDAILAAGELVVVDGSPRTEEQALLVQDIGTLKPFLVVELVADEALSRARMALRGNNETTIQRAQVRWENSEKEALRGLVGLRLDAAFPTAALLSEIRTVLGAALTSHQD